MLMLNNLVVSFDDNVVLNIDSLSISAGEKVAIIGPSGSGKSTLVHHIYELLRPTAALCSQRQGLVENLSVFHNIFMGALDRHSWLYNLINLALPFNKPQLQIRTIMDTLELDCPITQNVVNLSGGQRQRVALGRALFQQQSLFIGDEPFSAVDPIMGQRLLRHVFAAHESVIMVLHDTSMALANFDRVIGLQGGKKVLDCTSKNLNATMLKDFYQLQEKDPMVTQVEAYSKFNLVKQP